MSSSDGEYKADDDDYWFKSGRQEFYFDLIFPFKALSLSYISLRSARLSFFERFYARALSFFCERAVEA